MIPKIWCSLPAKLSLASAACVSTRCAKRANYSVASVRDMSARSVNANVKAVFCACVLNAVATVEND